MSAAALTAGLEGEAASTEAARRLIAAYPDQNLVHDGNDLVWPDGTRMPLSDGKGAKDFEALLSDPDLDDIFALPYPPDDIAGAPAMNADPGRARPMAFFDKMYGDCRQNTVAQNLVEVVWLPGKSGQKVKVTRVNGVAEKLSAVSAELDALPGSFDVYLTPAAGTYNCRVIAGTDRLSTHAHGIAIDIALARADYWRWTKPNAPYAYRNRVPKEIVRVFEKHGFIWGGKWYHYDTMHFEYRPELLMK